jgi:hypothetical protein
VSGRHSTAAAVRGRSLETHDDIGGERHGKAE